MSDGAPLLQVVNLHVDFPTEDGVVQAVHGVSYQVQRGRTLGIVGESGSGKTVSSLTTIGLTRTQGALVSGSILFEGRDLLTLPDDDLRRVRGNQIAMIFQDPLSSLHPFYKIGFQLVEAIRAHQDVSKGTARDRAVELLALVDIPDPRRRVDEYPHQFSGGMRQRAMIAMALANDPQLLIADEPTTALDVTVQAQILALLARLQRELGMAIILITHDLGVVAETADASPSCTRGGSSRRGRPTASSRRPSTPTPGACCARSRAWRRPRGRSCRSPGAAEPHPPPVGLSLPSPLRRTREPDHARIDPQLEPCRATGTTGPPACSTPQPPGRRRAVEPSSHAGKTPAERERPNGRRR